MQELERLRHERDLLQTLLELAFDDKPEDMLREALRLAMRMSGAKRGHLAVTSPEVGTDSPAWHVSLHLEQDTLVGIQRAVSHGVLNDVLRHGTTLRIVNAMLDPTWSQRDSVQRHGIEAVVCAPIGTAPPLGLLYLQGTAASGGFDDAVVGRVEWLANLLQAHARRALEARPPEDATTALRQRLDVDDLVGRSPAMARLLEQVELAARFDLPVLLTGPTGSGKSTVAHAIHRNSRRADRPLVHVNCAAIARGVFEAELFGAAPGAYTGAGPGGSEGYAAAADGGTLFLDEIGELSDEGQAALLTFLDTGAYHRVGEAQARQADVRLVSASNADLQAAARQGSFRADLLHRIAALTLPVPGLDERPSDLAPLAQHLLARAAQRHRVAPRTLTPGALDALRATELSGHVRQLGRLLETALLTAEMRGDDVLGPHHLFPHRGDDATPAHDFHSQIARAQRRILTDALTATDGNKSAAAERLDLSRSHFYALLNKLGLSP